jgi:hypothetical protein
MNKIKQSLDDGSKLLALSWKEPFGGLMLHNKIETRTWKTKYRGFVLICCSHESYKLDQLLRICGEKQYNRIIDLISEKIIDLNSGNAIAIGRLTNCRMMELEDENNCFVQYQPGLFCHVYKDITPIEPFPWSGTRKWSKVSREVISQIKFL